MSAGTTTSLPSCRIEVRGSTTTCSSEDHGRPRHSRPSRIRIPKLSATSIGVCESTQDRAMAVQNPASTRTATQAKAPPESAPRTR